MQTQETFAVAQIGLDSYVVVARGELDVAAAPALRDAVEVAVDGGGRRLVADLAAVTFLDSAALGVLVTSAKQLRAAGGELVVVTDDPRIVRIFEITGLDDVVRVERSLVEAVSGLASA
jgi:anti-sigma B factor antagonist